MTRHPYRYATASGSQRGTSTCRKRAIDAARRIARETREAVILEMPDGTWRLNRTSQRRITWTREAA